MNGPTHLRELILGAHRLPLVPAWGSQELPAALGDCRPPTVQQHSGVFLQKSRVYFFIRGCFVVFCLLPFCLLFLLTEGKDTLKSLFTLLSP